MSSVAPNSFNDTAERIRTRNPIQVLNFVRNFEDELMEYFETKDIHQLYRLRREMSMDTNLLTELSHNTDLCIVFSRKDLPLFFRYPAIHASLEELSTNSKLKIVRIEVNHKHSFSDYLQETINKVQSIYTEEDENLTIKNLKDNFAEKVFGILNERENELNEPLKKSAFCDLIRLYVAMNNATSEIIRGYYQSYVEKLTEPHNKSGKEIGKANLLIERTILFMEYFKFLNINQVVALVCSKLENIPITEHFTLRDRNEMVSQVRSRLENISNRKRDAWNQFLANIEQHYSAEDSSMVDVIAADSDMVDVLAAGPDPAVVTTVVGVPPNTMTALDAMKDCGEEPTEISSTPFWSIHSAQPAKNTVTQPWSMTAGNTVTQPRTGLTK